MKLPSYVLECLNALEAAGYPAYVVGGCVRESDYNVGLDAAIIMNPQTWVTTGHVGNFSDPLVDCKGCGRWAIP